MIDYQTIIVIENKKYVLASQVKLEDEDFGYLVNIEDNNDIMFARLDSDKDISKIEDADMIEALIPLLLNNQDFIKIDE